MLETGTPFFVHVVDGVLISISVMSETGTHFFVHDVHYALLECAGFSISC